MVKEDLSQNTSNPLDEARTPLRLARGIKRRHCLLQALTGALLKIADVAQRLLSRQQTLRRIGVQLPLEAHTRHGC